ncbi:MAG: hypothetical protein ABSD92_07910 [Candidatus Bathyarchaeia archaeon]
MPNKQWEYKIIDLVHEDETLNSEELLNQYGLNRWELITIVSSRNINNALTVNAYLKREKAPDETVKMP